MTHANAWRVTLALASLAVLIPFQGARAQVAIVVSPGSQVRSLKLEDLRGLFLGEVTLLDRDRVLLVEHPPSRKPFYRSALGMTEDRVKRHWIAVVFSGEGAMPPREIGDAVELTRFVAATPGAVGLLDASLVDNSVKVLAVEGLLPGDPAYPLRAGVAR